MRKKRKICNESKVVENIQDPTGFTIHNNPHPFEGIPISEDDWRCYFEWKDDMINPLKCHNCLQRAKVGSGNCVNGGKYFQCMPKWMARKKIKKTVQSKLM